MILAQRQGSVTTPCIAGAKFFSTSVPKFWWLTYGERECCVCLFVCLWLLERVPLMCCGCVCSFGTQVSGDSPFAFADINALTMFGTSPLAKR